MPGWVVVIIIAAIVLAGVLAWFFLEKRKTVRLRSHFGPEYERTLQEHHDRRRAEHELERRQQRVDRLKIHPLSMADRDRYVQAWRVDQMQQAGPEGNRRGHRQY